MRCTSPRTVGFKHDGKTIAWSQKNYSKEYATFQLPCGKCIECRLDYARQWAIRCVHEASMYPKNAFITLTYNEESLVSEKLVYEDFQKFMKRLRKVQDNPIGLFVTGEYGEHTKRPHWHAIIFNWEPSDGVYHYSNFRGDRVSTSETLTKLWGKGHAEYGTVTMQSAGYCARYAAKKLVHGRDDEHEYKPISKKSSKQAIGKKWLEKFHDDVFNYGKLVLADGTTSTIPRYYERWLKDHHPDKWLRYVTDVKQAKMLAAQEKTQEELDAYWANVYSRNVRASKPLMPNEIRKIIQKKQFEILQANLKI